MWRSNRICGRRSGRKPQPAVSTARIDHKVASSISLIFLAVVKPAGVRGDPDPVKSGMSSLPSFGRIEKCRRDTLVARAHRTKWKPPRPDEKSSDPLSQFPSKGQRRRKYVTPEFFRCGVETLANGGSPRASRLTDARAHL